MVARLCLVLALVASLPLAGCGGGTTTAKDAMVPCAAQARDGGLGREGGDCSSASASVHQARYAIDSSPDFSDLGRTARRHGIVILQPWRLDELRAIKAASPETKVLAYKNLSFAAQGTGPGGRSSSGVSHREAETHPEWFLKNADGERFTSTGYDFLWAMDVGSPSYQQRWADNVLAELGRHDWDGVLLDDANPTMKHHYDPARVARYPSDAAYSAATTSALRHIGPRIRERGKIAIANNATWVEYPDVGVGWLDHLDGMMDEMFLKWDRSSVAGGYRNEAQWTTQLEELKATEARGKIFIGVTQSPNGDAAAARYGFATSLLAGGGRAHFALHGDYTSENRFPEYELDLGAPTAEAARGADGVHRRRFASGLVLVNPTELSRTVPLGGSYSGSGLSRARSATMGPHSGLVLVEDP